MEYNLTKNECEMIDHLRNNCRSKNILDYLVKGTGVAIIWRIDDIKSQAEQEANFCNVDNPERAERLRNLTDEQALDILHDIVNQHDASIGINWDVISCHIDWSVR